MKVWVDQDLCTGDGLCEEWCPHVFSLQSGISYVQDHRGPLMAGAAPPKSKSRTRS